MGLGTFTTRKKRAFGDEEAQVTFEWLILGTVHRNSHDNQRQPQPSDPPDHGKYPFQFEVGAQQVSFLLESLPQNGR